MAFGGENVYTARYVVTPACLLLHPKAGLEKAPENPAFQRALATPRPPLAQPPYLCRWCVLGTRGWLRGLGARAATGLTPRPWLSSLHQADSAQGVVPAGIFNTRRARQCLRKEGSTAALGVFLGPAPLQG